ncbi:MAG: prolipoprotein diacylglyceryl transferase [Gammaproteobacteria bacterium]|nr:prolipoprotein diacylglyceryl transferase [Gammaproteobacteria bacterium]MDH5618229.1 prolipoprotein diacylglyceryl transferase [Gammaproteobacteria bacterium]
MYPHFDSTTWVTPFGLIFLAAIFTAWFFARRNARAISLDPSHVDLLIPITIIAGVAGATVVAMLLSVDEGIRVRLFSVIGAGTIALLVYSRIARLPFARLLDVFALPVLAALMVHRIGCFLAGCCWGDVVSNGFVRGIEYPPGSFAYEQHVDKGLIDPGALSSLPVHAVPLYEAALLLALLLVLSRVSWRRLATGTITILTVSSYVLIRFFLEYLRADSEAVLGNLTVIQLQCIVLMFGVLLLSRERLLLLRTRRPSR